MNVYVEVALLTLAGGFAVVYLAAYLVELRKALGMLANERRYLGYAPPRLLPWRMAGLLFPQPLFECAHRARRWIAHHGR